MNCDRLIGTLWRGLKPLVARISPIAAQLIPGIRMYLRSKTKHGPFQERMKPLLFGGKSPAVLSGPFEGMPYINEVGLWGPILPKWIGSYERELHCFIEEVLANPPQLIVDIGSAEGYYAVLLAARLPVTRVVSFDYNLLAVRAQRRLAAINHVTNLEIEKHCDHRRLADLISSTDGRVLVICDIEGAEMEMIDPAKCPALAKADMLVELHEGPGRSGDAMAGDLGARFDASHSATFIPMQRRDPGLYAPVCTGLTREDLEHALDEDRGASCGWLVLKRARQT